MVVRGLVLIHHQCNNEGSQKRLTSAFFHFDLMHLLHLPLPHQRGQPGILLVQSSVRCLTAELSDFSKEGGLGADGAGTGMGAAYGSTMRGRRSFHETGVVDLVAKAFDPEEKPPQGRARDGIVFVLNQTSIKT